MGKYLQLRSNAPKAEQLIKEFEDSLEGLLKQQGLPPGVAVTVIANMNFHGQDIPADIFKPG